MLTQLVTGSVVGATLGGFYFGVLWLTVRRVPDSRRPGVLVAGSYLSRLGVLAAGLYGVVRVGGAPALLAAVVGLVVVRQLVIGGIARHAGDVPGPTASERGRDPSLGKRRI